MNDRTDPAALDRPVADPAGSVSQPSAAATLNVADAIEIAQTCQLAGRADLIAGFLETNTAPAKVRSQLLSARADASPEIVSRIAPDATERQIYWFYHLLSGSLTLSLAQTGRIDVLSGGLCKSSEMAAICDAMEVIFTGGFEAMSRLPK